MFKNILLPTNGSSLSQKTAQQATRLAQATGAKLIALHVYAKFAGIEKLAGAAGVTLSTALVESSVVYQQIIAVARGKDAISFAWPRPVAAV